MDSGEEPAPSMPSMLPGCLKGMVDNTSWVMMDVQMEEIKSGDESEVKMKPSRCQRIPKSGVNTTVDESRQPLSLTV